MAAIRGLIAASLDGQVADVAGGVGWLAPFERLDLGMAEFLRGIGTVVMGRRTYEQVAGFGVAWPYAGKAAYVMARGVVPDLPDGARAWAHGAAALQPRLRAEALDVWVVGGPEVLADFIEAGAIDTLTLFVMPVVLGRGVPLWRPETGGTRLDLVDAALLEGGVVRLDYRFAA
jgi:dihydrofolate reductase